jgi:hypothetical protein
MVVGGGAGQWCGCEQRSWPRQGQGGGGHLGGLHTTRPLRVLARVTNTFRAMSEDLAGGTSVALYVLNAAIRYNAIRCSL